MSQRTPALMFQGTGSDVGKSLLVAGLCRAFKNRGLNVAPFKPQNMSNNAAVTIDGGEIGRAQALQAKACGLEPSVHMNPVLLKPQTDIGSQVVVQGRVMGNATAKEYASLKPKLMPQVLDSYEKLCQGNDLVLIEGAGSASEVNLRKGDIANMGFACAAQVPVMLIGDIDRGGVIASIIGTHHLLPDNERALLKGYLINKFRGDVSLFDNALDIIRADSGLESYGVVPFFEHARDLPDEDALSLERRGADKSKGTIKIAVPRLARIANFDDLDPLRSEKNVSVEIIPAGQPLPMDADLILIPGSKATLADLAYVREQGWDIDIQAHYRQGKHIMGLCGGYQMLGTTVSDPHGIEGPAQTVEGLGLLEFDTVLEGDKTLKETQGKTINGDYSVTGYEMHMGKSRGPALERPFLNLGGKAEGAVSQDARIVGTYVHGLFQSDGFRHGFLQQLSSTHTSDLGYEAQVQATLDDLAAHLEKHLNVNGLLKLAQQPV